MGSLLATLGWKYVKNITKGEYHHYKCTELNGVLNKKTYSKAEMEEDINRHPYTLKVCKCILERT